MKTLKTWASAMALVLSCNVLMANTYYIQSLGGADGSPPWPFDPYQGSKPLTEIAAGVYMVDDVSGESALASGAIMMADDDSPPIPGDGAETNTPAPPPAPNIRNYAKYGAQIFSWLDTNSALNELNDTNLYNACAAIAGPTNGLAWLAIVPYGPDGVLIRADNFDFGQTNADFALLVCDKLSTPTWKAVDFDHASDAQDGWLVQGTVPYAQVTGTMFFQVTNLNTAYNEFFQAIPYSGPQLAITGTNQPYDTVSNVITLTAQMYDLSGTTNETFLVDVNGNAISTRASLSGNTITLDTKYNPNGQDYGIDNVNLTAQGYESVYSFTSATNAPQDILSFYTSATSIPLDFENVNYLLFQSYLADAAIGTNVIEFVCNDAENIACTIADPNTSQVVASYGGSTTGPTTVEIPWNFTEADGVTPYSNSVYVVNFTASDPTSFNFANEIENNDGVRRPAGCFITYEQEPTFTAAGQYVDMEDEDWLEDSLPFVYQDMYDQEGISQYLPSQVGDNRQWSDCIGLTLGSDPFWGLFMPSQLSETYSNSLDGLQHPIYSDLTVGGAHGTGSSIGGHGQGGWPWLFSTFSPKDLQGWLQEVGPNWRLRKAALWACGSGLSGIYSVTNVGPNGETNGNELDFVTACGIRPFNTQMNNYIRKNTAWAIEGVLPFQLQGPDSYDSVAQVAYELDDLWVTGPNGYPGACDPTYASGWVWQQIRGMYISDLGASFDIYGYVYMPYTSIYDDEIWLLDHSNVKSPGY